MASFVILLIARTARIACSDRQTQGVVTPIHSVFALATGVKILVNGQAPKTSGSQRSRLKTGERSTVKSLIRGRINIYNQHMRVQEECTFGNYFCCTELVPEALETLE